MKNKGLVYILLSSLFFALMAASVKSVPNIPQAEKIFFRNFIGLIVMSIILFRSKTSVKPNNPKLITLRATFGLLGVACYYYSLSKLQLADAVIINKLSPFFVMIFAFMFLGEKFTIPKTISLIVAMLGASLVIKPTFDYEIIPFIIGIMGAVFAGSAYTVVRKLSTFDKPQIIVFYFCLFSSVVMLPFMMAGQFRIPTLLEAIGLLCIGSFALIAQLFMTNAYRYAPASELSIYTNANIVFSTIIGLIFWSEYPDALTIIGGILIILGSYINFRGAKKTA